MRILKFILFLVPLLFTNAYGINNCSSTDHTGTVSSVNAVYSNSDNVYWHGGSDWNRKRYYIEVQSAGHVEVAISSDNGGDVRFNASTDSCPDYHGAGTSWSHDFSGPGDFNIDVTAWVKKSSSQNYTISIKFTDVTTGIFLPFTLINPPYSRNIAGNYAIAGNTVLCLTGRTTGYGGTCHGDDPTYENITSNMRVSKYLDIDSDGGTWNSTSSYVEIPASYDATQGVIWAGLFWQGRVAWDQVYPIRYPQASVGGSTFTTVEVGEGGSGNPVDTLSIGANNIKLKVNNGTYHDVQAAKFHTYTSSNGETYTAYADVSSILQSSNITAGKNLFTVANLLTMEGREPSPGAYGGWSLVVIYGEDPLVSKPRNISIYNGFISIGQDDPVIKISGFKLPKTGTVKAQLSVFSGEGEYRYGRTASNNSSDWIRISDQENTGYVDLPGCSSGTALGNCNNIFDAQMTGILRDHIPGEFNDQSINNTGVDVDTFDVSELMTGYRDNNPDINSTYIKTFSDNDYITPSMIAFSSELYVPELCYDYTMDIDGHVLDSVNNEIKTPFGSFGKPLTTTLFLKSLEGDIDLIDVSINYAIQDTSQLSYKDCTTKISETGEYDYSDACPYTYNASDAGFDMYIGKGKTSSKGGAISAFESRYISFDSDFKESNIDTSFLFSVNYTVDFGSGAVPQVKMFSQADLCESTTKGFLPQFGYFNVTDINNDIDEWNLYTQTSRRPFKLKLYAHQFGGGYLNPISSDLNMSVEVEMIRADNFFRDANTACNDENSKLTDSPSKFVTFSNSKSEEISYDANDTNFAYRSVAMRVWYLNDVNNTNILIDNHRCTRTNQAGCVELYNREYAVAGECSTECAAGSTGCYDCLRTNYGQKVCSRDNFAIRPESFITMVYDSNESNISTVPTNFIADSTVTTSQFSLVGEYRYRYDVNATNHENNLATHRYIQHFSPGSPTHWMKMNWSPKTGRDVTGCNDPDDKNITLNVFNGSSVNDYNASAYTDRVDQIGEYKLEIVDQNWTAVDWDPAQMVHHLAPSPYSTYYKSGTDCIKDDTTVQPSNVTDEKNGCLISGKHTNQDTGTIYRQLNVQFYPYTFNLRRLNTGARPTNDGNQSTFVYINELNRGIYPNGIDENMSYNIQGTFTAVGHKGSSMSNFVNSCYAEDVNMTLDQNYTDPLAIPTKTPFLGYDIIDYNTTNTTHIIRPRENGTFAQINGKLKLGQGKNYFEKDMNGSITMDLGYNFDRDINGTLNPRKINMKSFGVGYSSPPPTVYVDMISDHRIEGIRNIDQNVTFVYGRAKPSMEFYDNILEDSTLTPIQVVVYCDLGFALCQERGIDVNNGQTNEASWWRSTNHNNVDPEKDGEIVIKAQNSGALSSNPLSIDITKNGENGNIAVSYVGSSKPHIENIKLVVFGDDPVQYTDRWLIHNEDNDTTPPDPFYRVRFVGSGDWSTTGNLPGVGSVVSDDINTKRSNRVEW